MPAPVINRLSDERGFSMVVVMLVMMVVGMFVVGAFAAANGDLPQSRKSQDRKLAYGAAEAGLNFYEYHLNAENDYWTNCTNVPAPNASEVSPVNQINANPRKWRFMPGSTSVKYTIDLLPATGYTQCIQGNGSSMLDPNTGTFRIRVTGQSNNVKRSVIGTFRRISFLDYVYFTDFETRPPLAYATSSQQTSAATQCDDYRGSRGSMCVDLVFSSDDKQLGPFHSNDTIRICDDSTFGRSETDRLESSQASPGYTKDCGNTNPNFVGTWRAGAQKITMPTTNNDLVGAVTTAYKYTGKTYIRLKGSVMDVYKSDGTKQTNVALPSNGVIYVQNGSGGCPNTSPQLADYAEGSGCGNAYVSGTYSQSLTIGAANDVIVAPLPPGGVWPGTPASNVSGSSDSDIIRSGDVVLGLISNNFVRIAHRVSRQSDGDCNGNVNSTNYPNIGDVRVDAAILSVNQGFLVDNWTCGNPEGTLTINGAIAQKFRGAVAQGGSSGYLKNYNYDDRLRYRSPPFFLEPVAAAWNVIRINEQIPAT